MSITDELRTEARGFGDYVYTSKQAHRLLEIADRIDAEHERVRAESIIDMTDERMAENGWIRLPKDADGEPIRVGDEVVCINKRWTVTGLRLTGGFWGICCTIFNDQGGSGTNVYPPDSLTHYKPPTVEDVLEKMLERAVGYSDAHTTVALNTIAEYATKLQLASNEE